MPSTQRGLTDSLPFRIPPLNKVGWLLLLKGGFLNTGGGWLHTVPWYHLEAS